LEAAAQLGELPAAERERDDERARGFRQRVVLERHDRAVGAELEERDAGDPERRKMILYGSFFTRTLWAMTYSAQSQAQCYECIRVCPVGTDRYGKR
jgi:hypothetical protein